MVAEKDDWRRAGQERFLREVSLRWTSYRKPRESWDHDHCAFCRLKFMDAGAEDIETAGYVTRDARHWICKGCFEDFKDEFRWHVEA